jgi:hypothetical protein
MKSLHRLIMTSNAYRQSSRYDEGRHAADPDNRLLSRFPFRRMDAEAVHDSLLKVTGRLDETPFGPPAEIDRRGDGEVTGVPTAQGYRRAIYLLQRRSSPVTVLEVYDAPIMNPNCIKRGQSTVTLQALQLMNSDLAVKSAQYMAGRVIDAGGDDLARQVERVYLAALSRRPSAGETTDAITTIKGLREAWDRKFQTEKPAEPASYRAKWLAMAGFCHTVLNSAEFLYVD